MKKCPNCTEENRDEATVCIHCGDELSLSSGNKFMRPTLILSILGIIGVTCSMFTLCILCPVLISVPIIIGSVLNDQTTNTLDDGPIATNIQTVAPTKSSTNTSLPTTKPTRTTQPSPTPTDTLTSTPSITPTSTLTPSITPTITPLAKAGAKCIPLDSERVEAEVVEIIDGDTIRVRIDGVTYSLRYIGMDTPENTNPSQYFSAETTEKNRQLVGGKTVLLIKDVSDTDRYGRLLRYVVSDGIFVNYDMVSTGYAIAAEYPPDISCADTFSEAEAKARQGRIGIWLPTNTPRPQPTRTSTPWPTAIPYVPPPTSPPPAPSNNNNQPSGGGNCDPAYPGVCIPPPPPDLDCGEIPFRRFQVLPPDPHGFDGDNDGIGCESG
jgi:micrococcal nuclease